MAGSTVYVDLNHAQWGSGTTVKVTVITSTRALVFYGAVAVLVDNAGDLLELSYRVTGATTIAASTAWATRDESGSASDESSAGRAHYVANLTAGSNTFHLQALISNGSATGIIRRPYLTVIAL